MHIDLFYELSVPDVGNRNEAQVYDETIKEIEFADKMGLNAAWLVEHHFMREYSHSASPELFLAAVSQRTQNIRLGQAIIPVPYHHPLHIAERIATLDILSNGRLEVGFGRGFQPREYQAYGVDIADSRELTIEGIEVVQQALDNQKLNYTGNHHRLRDIELIPRPIQKPYPPMWMAAVSPASFKLAADMNMGVLCGPFKPWFMVKEDIERYKTRTRRHGHFSRIGMTVGFLCLNNAKQAQVLAKPAFEWFYKRLFESTAPILHDLYQSYEYYYKYRYFKPLLKSLYHYHVLEKLDMIIVGDAEHCIAKLSALKKAGVDNVMLSIGAGVIETKYVHECLSIIGNEITPAIDSVGHFIND